MKRFITMLAFALATLATSAHAEFKWEHFGASPYAATREEAMKTRESAFKALGLPEKVVAEFIVATEKAGEKTRINVGDKLDAMLSKGGVAHRDVLVAFGSPAKGMEFAAPAEKWTVAWEGKTYTIFLPEVCNNWSSAVKTEPLRPLPAAAPPVAKVVVSEKCPNGYSITAYAWDFTRLPNELLVEAKSHIGAATVRESDHARRLSAYTPDDVSRTMGGRLRKDVVVTAPVKADLKVRYVDVNLGTEQVITELGELHMVGGIGTFQFTDDPRQRVVGLIWPANFVSPTVSGGERRLRVFPNEWGNWCTLFVHGLVPMP